MNSTKEFTGLVAVHCNERSDLLPAWLVVAVERFDGSNNRFRLRVHNGRELFTFLIKFDMDKLVSNDSIIAAIKTRQLSLGCLVIFTQTSIESVRGRKFRFILDGKVISMPTDVISDYQIASDDRLIVNSHNALAGLCFPASIHIVGRSPPN